MPRVRLGVALLVPEPVATEIDGLRRALGDGALGRVPPHLTLVPPVNVRHDELAAALEAWRQAVAGFGPTSVTLGPPATFLPDTPVLYLPVLNGRERVGELRGVVFRKPLARELTWPFTAHVTVADEATADRIEAARLALCDYRAEVTFESVHILREGPGRIWETLAEAPLATPRVFGRGGLALEVASSEVADPDAGDLLARGDRAVVLTARRDGQAVGVLDLVLAPGERALGTAAHLRRALDSVELDG